MAFSVSSHSLEIDSIGQINLRWLQEGVASKADNEKPSRSSASGFMKTSRPCLLTIVVKPNQPQLPASINDVREKWLPGLFKNVQADYSRSSHLLQKESDIYRWWWFANRLWVPI
jgi:hypothetical protein